LAGLLIITSVLIIVTIFFEACKDGLREYVRIEYLPIVDHMYGELTVLGFVGLVLFMLESGKVLTTVSKEVFFHADATDVHHAETRTYCNNEEVEAEKQVSWGVASRAYVRGCARVCCILLFLPSRLGR
jgi:hypothetical protein